MKSLKNIKLKLKNKPIIILDCDSVLLDWVTLFMSFLEIRGYCLNHIKNVKGTTKFTHVSEFLKNSDVKVIDAVIKDFNSGDSLEKLPPFESCTKEVVKELSLNYNLVVLSCLGSEKSEIEKRNKNLLDVFGDVFSGIICIKYGESKENYIKAINQKYDVTTFIDDRYKHIEESLHAGVKPILFFIDGDLYDMERDDFFVINSIKEINNII